jgi:hypothetical protein
MSSHAPATLSRVEPQTTGHAREERIAALAATQHGIVTREQLMELGLSRSAVGRRLRSGRLRPLHTGVYLMGPIEPDCARGIQVIRLTWRQITRDATATAVQVGQILALARAQRSRTATPGGSTVLDWATDAGSGRIAVSRALARRIR